jgi:hypothetical protein
VADPTEGHTPSPDELEQRQFVDGTREDEVDPDEVPDHPLTADELEQRQVVEDDEEDHRER